MSNYCAIAAVSATLQKIITDAGTNYNLNPPIEAESKPPSELSSDTDYVNIYPYNVRENVAARNLDLPARDSGGRRMTAYPLVLDIKFILTAYSTTPLRSELLFGIAVQALHENPVLTAKEITAAVNAEAILKEVADLAAQVEQVKITPKTLDSDEVSKLWSAFQTPYRTSATYEVSVVIIESKDARTSPLPVAEVGLHVHPAMASPLPTLTSLEPPNRQAAVRVGETLKLSGEHLNGNAVKIRFRHRATDHNVSLSVAGENKNAKSLSVVLASDKNWAVGTYGVSVSLIRPGEAKARTTNEFPVNLAPTARIKNGNITWNAETKEAIFDKVECDPVPTKDQSVALLISSRMILGTRYKLEPPVEDLPEYVLKFTGKDIEKGEYYYRLRVDGVDSLVIKQTVDGLAKLDDDQKLRVGPE